MKINLRNPSNTRRIQEPVTFGVPCPQSSVQSDSQFVLRDHNRTIVVQTTPLSLWPDKSVKWLLCDFLVDLDPEERILLTLDHCKSEKKAGINYSSNGRNYEVNTGAALFTLDFSKRLPFKQVQVDGQDVLTKDGSQIRLKNQINQTLVSSIDTVDVESQGDIRLSFSLSGRFGTDNQLIFRARLHFYANTAKSCLEFTLHNPNSAVHPDGLWDLGDPSSVLFKELALSLVLNNTNQDDEVRFQLAPEKQWQTITSNNTFRINQESSGGENWDSHNHRNRDGRVPMTKRGYSVSQNGQVVSEGKRAQPIVWVGRGKRGLTLVVPRFWQEFPKALDIDSNALNVSLFPECYPDLHELQGGEQKTHNVYFDFASSQEDAGWGVEPIQVSLDPQTINDTKAIRGLTCCEAGVSQEYQEFLSAALEGQNSFFSKCEAVDEYGWRNYGELYADHEGVNHKGDKPLVSHYNNQYDPISSFYREFLRTGDSRWSELAFNLARHVIDIDINNTDQDREEYCHGLFWHTDHYLDAGTATHRMASREHLAQKNPAFCGGGPGAEHCYANGLMLHYCLTGDPSCREAVIRLAKWSVLALRGPQTILASLLRCKNRISQYRGKSSGEIWLDFPISRGTGNCISVCLDAFELSGEKHFINTAFSLISETVHPADDIEKRDLLNAEYCWSYTVFLVALVKFLEVKRELNELDQNYVYARDCLLQYVMWMEQNEYPYLEKPKILEYPNETWAAQDLRKSLIFHKAVNYATSREMRERFNEREIYFYQASFAELEKWDSKYLTRPLVLVLQNGWIGGTSNLEDNDSFETEMIDDWGLSPFRYNFVEMLRRQLLDFKRVLSQTNIKREWSWLRARLL
ncbi:hypothetical protein [Desulforhopalus sp. IMCC35007]|uniref:RIFT barrel domain-containing protein n=1 Tax=Desulforhopalus sp. IMCC35007 TaxID=2569543 RepID=UPI001138D7EC|nr:hypothetical protein [Desulforhopalus sp. IMCC35007]TKB07414.1 hypothetical protein FCL48_16860 [Desulforhopalus sp. IMCC35007]